MLLHQILFKIVPLFILKCFKFFKNYVFRFQNLTFSWILIITNTFFPLLCPECCKIGWSDKIRAWKGIVWPKFWFHMLLLLRNRHKFFEIFFNWNSFVLSNVLSGKIHGNISPLLSTAHYPLFWIINIRITLSLSRIELKGPFALEG